MALALLFVVHVLVTCKAERDGAEAVEIQIQSSMAMRKVGTQSNMLANGQERTRVKFHEKTDKLDDALTKQQDPDHVDVDAKWILPQHIVKLKEAVKGKKFAAFLGPADGGEDAVLNIPGAGIKEESMDSIVGGLPPPANYDELIGENVRLSEETAKNHGPSAIVIAAGVGSGKTHVVAKDAEGGIIMVSEPNFMTQKEVQAQQNGHHGEDEDGGSASPGEPASPLGGIVPAPNDHSPAKYQAAKNAVAEKIANGDHDFHGSQLMSKEEWANWMAEGKKSKKLQELLDEEVGDSIEKIDDAVHGVEQRQEHMQNLAQTANDNFDHYRDAIAIKAKMFGQLEYKGHDLPLTGVEHNENNEDIRNADLDRIRELAVRQKKVVKHYNEFVKNLLANSAQQKKDMQAAFEAHFEHRVSKGEFHADGRYTEETWEKKRKEKEKEEAAKGAKEDAPAP